MEHAALELSEGAEPVLCGSPRDERTPSTSRPRRLGRLRLPIAGPYRPWATAYRLPDGRIVWCVRLWEVDRAVRRCVGRHVVHAFCRMNRLHALEAEVDRVEAGCDGP